MILDRSQEQLQASDIVQVVSCEANEILQLQELWLFNPVYVFQSTKVSQAQPMALNEPECLLLRARSCKMSKSFCCAALKEIARHQVCARYPPFRKVPLGDKFC